MQSRLREQMQQSELRNDALYSQRFGDALPGPSGHLQRAFERNQGQVYDAKLDDTPWARILVNWITEVGSWEGTTEKLLERLNSRATDVQRESKAWPKSGLSLAKKLTRMLATFEKQGIQTVKYRDNSARLIRFTYQKPEPVADLFTRHPIGIRVKTPHGDGQIVQGEEEGKQAVRLYEDGRVIYVAPQAMQPLDLI